MKIDIRESDETDIDHIQVTDDLFIDEFSTQDNSFDINFVSDGEHYSVKLGAIPDLIKALEMVQDLTKC